MEAQGLRERLRTVEESHHRDVGGMEDRLAEMQLQLDEVGGGEREEGRRGGERVWRRRAKKAYMLRLLQMYIFF